MTGDMESIINAWCIEQMEYIHSGFDLSETMEFNYVSSKIKGPFDPSEKKKEGRGDIEFISNAVASSEFIENVHNEFVGERRVDDQAMTDEIQADPEKSIGGEKKIHKKVGVKGGENFAQKKKKG